MNVNGSEVSNKDYYVSLLITLVVELLNVLVLENMDVDIFDWGR